MHIAIEGCAHGELETIYKCITELEKDNNIKIDLLICCGDFQSVRNENDLRCMAVPPKYYDMCSFYKYYSGQLVAPVLTIFIGGNHEASNYLQELPFGGWVAPNIYYLGYAGVVNYKGLRIGGISGIYKGRDYCKGHFESAPYSEDTKRSVYHIRNIEVFRLKQVKESVDIFLSHDWPSEITNYGNVEQLLKFKPFFKEDIEKGNLGSPPCDELLFAIKPKYWFSAHLHCKFAALVPHENSTTTKFLALDKCVPRKRFLQVIEMPTEENSEDCLKYDLEWLTILSLTAELFSTKCTTQFLPSGMIPPTESQRNQVLDFFEKDLTIPNNFQVTATCYKPGATSSGNIYQPNLQINPQTTEFCTKLCIPDPTEELTNEKADVDDKSEGLSTTNDDNDASQTFIEDDSEIVENTSNVSVGFKRKSLVLPDAKNNTTEEVDEVGNSLNEEEIVLENTSELPENELTESVEIKNLAESQEDNNGDNKPAVKKFKRRNASIYEHSDA